MDDTRSTPGVARRQRLEQGADLCVKCGLCLETCPTYRLERNEADSPRGRIALIQGLVQERIRPTAAALGHLDGCLACRACEVVCPSGVPYGSLIDDAYAELWGRGAVRPSPLNGVLAKWPVALGRMGAHGLAVAAWVARRLIAMGAGGSRMLRLTAQQGASGPPGPAYGNHRAVGARRGKVALHLGCVSRLVEPAVQNDAVRLLNAAGYDVAVPRGQACCGAIHLHAGDVAEAQALARRNRQAFGIEGVEAIVSCASGCGATLAAYPEQGVPVWDVAAFLAAHGADGLRFRPLAARVAVHDPCTLRNVMGQHREVYRLLARIPGLEVSPLAGNDTCCGAAGTHLVARPATADALVAPKLAAARAVNAHYLATSNVGCALNLRLARDAAGAGPEVLHPVQLLARQLVD